MDEENKQGGTGSTSEQQSQDTQQQQQGTENQNESDFDYGKEFDRVNGGSKYSPAEKATNSFKGILKELTKHGIDPRSLLEEKQQDGGTQDNQQQQQAEKPITAADIQRMIDEGVKKERSALFDPIIDSKIAPLSRSEGEAKLIKHYASKFIADGVQMDEAIEIGWTLANRHRFKQTFAEIVRGKAADSGKTDGQGSGQKKPVGKQEPTGKEADFAKSRGLVWDEGEGRFISPARKAHLDKTRKQK